MDWESFLRASPNIGVEFDKRLERDEFCLLATIRSDGTPRISAVEATLAEGNLVFGMPHNSTNARDLKRDSRCAVHSAVFDKENREGDFKLSGLANEIVDPNEFEALQDPSERESGWRPPFGAAFYVTIEVKVASYSNAPTGKVIVWSEAEGESNRRVARVGDVTRRQGCSPAYRTASQKAMEVGPD